MISGQGHDTPLGSPHNKEHLCYVWCKSLNKHKWIIEYKVKQIFWQIDKEESFKKSLSAHCLYTGLNNFITNCSSVYWYFTVFILAIVKSAKYKLRQSFRLKSIYMGEQDYMLF